MPGAVKTVEAQIHVKAHKLLTKLVDGEMGEHSFAPPAEKTGGKQSKVDKADKSGNKSEGKADGGGGES